MFGLRLSGAKLGDAHTFENLVGTGYLAVTIDPRQGERYQGIVPLESINFRMYQSLF